MNMTPMDTMRNFDRDDFDPYEEAVSDHERRTGHVPKLDMLYCEMCVVLFNFAVEDGKYCRFHPDSYFEPKTKEKKSYCESCDLEETI